MINEIKKNSICVIRSVGESTTDTCLSRCVSFFGENNVVVIYESPFENAIKKCFEIGIDSGKKWLMVIDADVIPAEHGLESLLRYASASSENLFEVQGNVYDFSFGGWRQAGNHLYRVSLLSKAIELIPGPGESLRPESTTIKRMAGLGYEWSELDFKIGLHDFEQYPKDYFRKALLFNKKFKRYIPILKFRWKKNEHLHYGFKYLINGIEYKQNVENQDYLNADKVNLIFKSLDRVENIDFEKYADLDINDYNNTFEFKIFQCVSFISNSNLYKWISNV